MYVFQNVIHNHKSQQFFLFKPTPEIVMKWNSLSLKLTNPLHSRRVYEKDGKIYKLYNRAELDDKEERWLDLGISYLQPKRQQLSKDGRFYMLTYDFTEHKER